MTFFSVPGDRELDFKETFDPEGCQRLQSAFVSFVHDHYPQESILLKESTDLSSTEILKLAPILSRFIASAFQVNDPLDQRRQNQKDKELLFWCRRAFLQRTVKPLRETSLRDKKDQDEHAAVQGHKEFAEQCATDLGFARFISQALEAKDEEKVSFATQYALKELNKPRHLRRPLFQIQEPLDPKNPVVALEEPELIRSDFSLFDEGIEDEEAFLESKTCLKCHEREKDFCRTGLKTKPAEEKQSSGCPLDQKISEMMHFKDLGDDLAALIVIMIDNPLVAATGHRICYDCSDACIFQKQSPVNIPSTETQILRAILELPYGAEIYGLLLRWHPLRLQGGALSKPTGKRVLVVGVGPAGFGLCYHLAVLGHEVLGIDGSEIRALHATLPKCFAGDKYTPLKDFKAFEAEDLPLSGFGGVAEYGITARWNKSYLRLIRLQLERLKHVHVKGAVRFGSGLTPETALNEFGFDYIALATGAGQQKQLLKDCSFNEKLYAPGIRHASDFLMSLQLQGAKRQENFIPLDIDFPIHVVGGGLTAIDTATEAQAYFLFYLERLKAFRARLDDQGYAAFLTTLTTEEQERFERHSAWSHEYYQIKEMDPGPKGIAGFLKKYGGVNVLYRGSIGDAPSVRDNPHEVQSALDQGIIFHENQEVEDIELDHHGRLAGLKIKDTATKSAPRRVTSRALFIAIGTASNRVIKDEYPGLLDQLQDESRLGYFGDADQKYEGSVVKALASAKKGALDVDAYLSELSCDHKSKYTLEKLLAELTPVVQECQPLSDCFCSLKIRAPLAARQTQPGHLFKLHIPSDIIPERQNLRAIPLLVESIDKEEGSLSFCVRTTGLATRFIPHLKPGMSVNLMGPTGASFPAFSDQNTIVVLTTYLRVRSLVAYLRALKESGKSVELVFLDQPEVTPELTSSYAHLAKLWAWKSYQLPLSIEGGSNEVGIFVHSGQDHMAQVLDVLNKSQSNQAVVGSVSTSMQCMMKAICAQCLQRVEDPETGEIRYVFACKDPYQLMTKKDVAFSHRRQNQNDLTLKIYKSLGESQSS